MIEILAYLFMFIDHIGLYFLDNDILFRLLGRLSLPFFIIMFCRGCSGSRSSLVYFDRLSLLAIASQLPYILLTHSYELNFIFTLSFALGIRIMLDNNKTALPILALIMSFILPLEYGLYGILFCLIITEARFNILGKVFLLILLHIAYMALYGSYIQLIAIPAYLFAFYFEDFKIRLPRALKYSLYPGHMIIFAIALFFINKN